MNSGASQQENGISRRDILKALASIPVLGVFFVQFFRKLSFGKARKNEILEELNGIGVEPVTLPRASTGKNNQLIRVGVIGFGARGEQLSRELGFAHPEWVEQKKTAMQKNKYAAELPDWLNQEDLNVSITGICDVFDMRAERALEASRNDFYFRERSRSIPGAKRFRDYREMLQSSDIDAVVITTPDFHHAQMTIDAAKAGKHVYCEKCMTRTEDEVFRVDGAVRNSGIVFQLGHQNTQNMAFATAREVINKNILGKITLIETTTNRNTPEGAWIRHLDKDGNLKPGSAESIDWKLWLGARPYVPFSLDRYYNWTKWWDYATGLSGQLFCHEFDTANQLLGLGIPASVVASGGIYYYKDNREIPDVFHAVCEFPNKDLSLVYSASLRSSRSRGRVFMGHDASMEVGATLTVNVDENTTRFKDKLNRGIVDPSLPLFSYHPDSKGIDVVTSATEKYYATRGLMYTYRDGRRVNTAYLHLREWLDCIRNGGTTTCNIDKGIEEAITCHMATKSYREKRRVEWDPVRKRIV